MNHDFQTIVISGGLTAGVADIAQFGETLLEREDGETIERFHIRARAAACAAGAGFVTFGGLPKMGMNLEDDPTVDQPKGE
jgi:hypothetical protein